MNCEYCGSDNQKGKTCEKCGAPMPEKPEMSKSEPFFYNGYICYRLREYATDTVEIQFWLGHELIERIVVPLDVLRARVPEYCDTMPFFWDLFLLARGETEVLKYQELNSKFPATFEVRRIENPEKERWLAMNLLELAREARR